MDERTEAYIGEEIEADELIEQLNEELESINNPPMRNILGFFFMIVAIMGAIGMVSEMMDWDLIEDAWKQFVPRTNNGGGVGSSFAPIYYTGCLFAGCWLLYGKRY